MDKSNWELLRADRSWSNESIAKGAYGCVAKDGVIIQFVHSPEEMKDWSALLGIDLPLGRYSDSL